MVRKLSKKKPLWLKVIIAFAVTALVGLLVFVAYFIYSYANSLPYSKSPYDTARSGDGYQFIDKGGYFELQPNSPSGKALIMYPGAFAEPQAYVASLAELTKAGITVFIIKSPLNFALLDSGAAKRIIGQQPQINDWYVAGHSLGGVTACEFAKSNQALIKGLILLGSYCNGQANSLKPKVLSIYATNDGLTELKDVEKSRTMLPSGAEFVAIEGGNHTQFGTFAKLQPGDKPAAISQDEQTTQLIQAIRSFIGD